MNRKHIRRIQLCLQYAKRSKVPHYKHCAILVKGNKILSIGINKMKAGCLGHPLYEYKGWHSELDCLHKLSLEEVKGAILYVAGLSKGGNIVTSKPCKYCQQYLNQFDLKAIYYSLPNGEYGIMKIS